VRNRRTSFVRRLLQSAQRSFGRAVIGRRQWLWVKVRDGRLTAGTADHRTSQCELGRCNAVGCAQFAHLATYGFHVAARVRAGQACTNRTITDNSLTKLVVSQTPEFIIGMLYKDVY